MCCSSLAIVSANLHARDRGGDPLAVRGRGVSRAITSSRCTGGRLEAGPALVLLPGRHLPSLDRRGPGPSRTAVAAERARITAPHPPASASGGRRWTTSDGSASRASSDRDRSSSRAPRTGRGTGRRRRLTPPPRTTRRDVVGHDQLVDGPGDPAARGVDDLEGERRRRRRPRGRRRAAVTGRWAASELVGRRPSSAASAWTPTMPRPEAIASKQPRRPHGTRAPSGSRTTWPISPARPRDAAMEPAVEDDAGRDPGADAEVGEVVDVGRRTRRSWRPAAAARTSFSIAHRDAERSASRRPSGSSCQPRLTARVTRAGDRVDPAGDADADGREVRRGRGRPIAQRRVDAPRRSGRPRSPASPTPVAMACRATGSRSLVGEDDGDLAAADVDAGEEAAVHAAPRHRRRHQGRARGS